MPITCIFMNAAIAGAIGSGFQNGYNTAVLNTPETVIKQWINTTFTDLSESKLEMVWSINTSIFALGGMFGGAATQLIVSFLGRRNGMIANNGLALLAGILMCVCKLVGTTVPLILGRFIIGLHSGLGAGIGPMYLTEISEMKYRGAVGASFQLVITISIMVAMALGTEPVLGSEDKWPILLGLVLIIPIYQTIAFIFAPESPKQTLFKGKFEKAYEDLSRLRGKSGSHEVDDEFEEIKNDVKQSLTETPIQLKEIFGQKRYATPLLLLSVLMVGQQLSGINAVILYSTSIFKTAKLSEQTSQILTTAMGVVNCLTTVVAMPLIEIAGRKILLLIGFFGMAVVTSILYACLFFTDQSVFVSYIAVISVFTYIILFAVGAGPIPWIIGSELFATRARATAISIAVPLNWFFNFVVQLSFPNLRRIMNQSVFVIFIVCQIVVAVFILLKCPETKNRPIEEIVAHFAPPSSNKSSESKEEGEE